MLDIELIQTKPNSKQPIIYIYRSGALRLSVRNWFIEQSKVQGSTVEELSLSEFVGPRPDGFFPTKIMCDCDPNDKTPDDATLKHAASRDLGVLWEGRLLIVHEKHKILRQPWWPDVERRSCVAREELITSTSLVAYLRHLDQTNDFASPGTFVSQPFFNKYFMHMVKDPQATLAELMLQFDAIVLTRMTRDYVVLPPDVKEDQGDGGTGALRHLRRLVSRQQLDQLRLLLAACADWRQRGWTVQRRHIQIYSLTERLFGAMSAPSVKGGPRLGSDFSHEFSTYALWTGVLLGWQAAIEHQLPGGKRTPDMFAVHIDALARDFLRRFTSDAPDPLVDLWHDIRVTLQSRTSDNTGSLARARRRVLEKLDHGNSRSSAAPPWLNRLCDLAQDAIRRGAIDAIERGADRERSPMPLTHDEQLLILRSLDEVVGQTHAVRIIRSWVCNPERTAGFVLHGPDGVGKHGVAAAVTRSLLCETISESGMPCGRCLPCTHGLELGQTVFDAVDADPDDFARLTVEDQRWPNFIGRRVIVIDRIDQVPTQKIDQMLKTLEAPRTPTFFILLSTDLMSVRPAVRSRCAAARLSPLGRLDSVEFIARVANKLSMVLEGDAVDCVTDVGGGLPSRLVDAMIRLRDEGVQDAAGAVDVLQADWPLRVSLRWILVLKSDKPLHRLLGRSARISVSREEEARDAIWNEQTGHMLAWVGLLVADGPTPTGHLDLIAKHVDDVTRDVLLTSWRSRAQREGTTPQEMWSRLSSLKLSDIWSSDPDDQPLEHSRRAMTR